MGHDHSHSHLPPVAGNERRLRSALVLTTVVLVAEVVGGIVTNSLALLSDAAHMFTDVTALAIALAALRIGRRPADMRRSYGYQRFEILAAAFNALLLFAAAGYIIIEAYRRFIEPPEVHAEGMLAVATLGLVVNLISMRLLAAGREDSLNVKGAYLEVWSDMLGSAGVILAAVAIRFTGWQWLDPAVAVAIGLWVLPRTWMLLKDSTHILLEGTPADVDVESVKSVIAGFPGVTDVHDLHVWTLTSSRHVLTAHVVIDGNAYARRLVKSISEELASRFRLSHTTLQLEDEVCENMHPIAPATARGADLDHGRSR